MPQSLEKYDAIIIGAGAAGLMCAIEAGKAGVKVLILDRAKNVGKKILVSGGGKCNFTNLNISSENYISQNPDFCRHALEALTPKDFLRLTARHGIEYFEKKSGQLFCAGGSEEILSMLAKERKKAGVKIILDCDIAGISRDDGFLIDTSAGKFRSDALVIATGGKSYPQLGASGFAYIVAEQFGIDATEIRPALVSLIFDAPEKRLFRDISGLSIDAEVRCGEVSFREKILFTHKGLSGPAILQISSYWKPGETITIDSFPGADLKELLSANAHRKTMLSNFLANYLPKRFSEAFINAYLDNRPLNSYSKREFGEISEKLCHWKIQPSGTEGFAKAEATLGGINTLELSSKTMESKKIPGLYFVGEAVDVTGHLGGYNLQWAWSSGAVAGRAIAEHQ